MGCVPKSAHRDGYSFVCRPGRAASCFVAKRHFAEQQQPRCVSPVLPRGGVVHGGPVPGVGDRAGRGPVSCGAAVALDGRHGSQEDGRQDGWGGLVPRRRLRVLPLRSHLALVHPPRTRLHAPSNHALGSAQDHAILPRRTGRTAPGTLAPTTFSNCGLQSADEETLNARYPRPCERCMMCESPPPRECV